MTRSSNPARFGIVGGHGATGRVVVSQLCMSSPGEIRLGARDVVKASALAATFDRRVSATRLDVLDVQSLDEFCSECSIIVNCGGPVVRLQDCVAQAALRNRCHYVDLAGMGMVKERLLPRSQQITDLGLSFVVSAGWIPGLSEFLPMYAHAQAKPKMDTIDSLTVYFGDSGEWSPAAFRDMAWFLRRVGHRHPGYFHKGVRIRASMLKAPPIVDLGDRIGLRRFSLFSTPEQDQLARALKESDICFCTYLPSFRVALAAALVTWLPLPEGLSVRMLQRAFRPSALPVGGFVVAKVVGRSQGSQVTFTAEVIYEQHRDYWINAIVAATVARWIAEGRAVRQGVYFLAHAVEPIAFMSELRKCGIEQNEAVQAK